MEPAAPEAPAAPASEAPESAREAPRSAAAMAGSRNFGGDMLRAQIAQFRAAGPEAAAPQEEIPDVQTKDFRPEGFAPDMGEPCKVHIDPGTFTLTGGSDAGWKKNYPPPGLGAAFDGNKLDINKVTPEMINGLTPTDAKTLMNMLHEHGKAKVSAEDGAGKSVTHHTFGSNTDKTDMATALAMKIFSKGDSQAMAKLIAADPTIINDNTGSSDNIQLSKWVAHHMSPEMMGEMMKDMKAINGGNYSTDDQDAVRTLTKDYLKANGTDTHGDTTIDETSQAMKEFMVKAGRNGMLTDPKDFGLLNGAMINGFLEVGKEVKADREQMKAAFDAVLGKAGDLGGEIPGFNLFLKGVEAGKNFLDKSEESKFEFGKLANKMYTGTLTEIENNPPPGWGKVYDTKRNADGVTIAQEHMHRMINHWFGE